MFRKDADFEEFQDVMLDAHRRQPIYSRSRAKKPRRFQAIGIRFGART